MIRDEQTLAALASMHGVHQTMTAQCKRQAIEGMAATFSGKQAPEATISPVDVVKLHAKTGQMLVERDFSRDASVRLGLLRGGKRLT